jgi:hypothetical protein
VSRTAAAALAAALALAAAAACEREHRVQVKLGADDGMLGLGFRCVDDQGALLFGRAVTGGRLEFSVIVDLIGVGDTVPGCRGEEIIRACPREQECPTLVVSADGRRACVPLSIPPPFDDPAVVVPKVLDALRGLVITDDAPDRPVIVRAVATTERCEDRLVAPQGDTYPVLDPDRAIGCAYSCPLQLDTVDAVSLYLDALDEHCEAQVRACAAFPRRAP